jgi:hypothetical protein
LGLSFIFPLSVPCFQLNRKLFVMKHHLIVEACLNDQG